MKRRLSFASTATALLVVMCLGTGCQKEPERQSTPPLAEARADEANLSPGSVKNPYKKVGENLLERTVFETAGPEGLRIELRDLFVAPGTTAKEVSLSGPSILQVMSGEGTITTVAKSEELKPGISLTLPQDVACDLQSRGITPLVLRARIFTPEPQPSPTVSRREQR